MCLGFYTVSIYVFVYVCTHATVYTVWAIKLKCEPGVILSQESKFQTPGVTPQLVVKHCCFVKEKKIKLKNLHKDLSEVQIRFVPHQWKGEIWFQFVCPLRGYDVTSDIIKPFPYISYTLS